MKMYKNTHTIISQNLACRELLPQILIKSFSFYFFGRNNQQSLLNILGSLYVAIMLNGYNNGSSVIPFVVTERDVLYREKYSGMYSPWAYSLAQV